MRLPNILAVALLGMTAGMPAGAWQAKRGAGGSASSYVREHFPFTTDGAIINAETFIAGLKGLTGMSLVDFLNDQGKAIAAYKPAAK